jgi:hypothetical protein
VILPKAGEHPLATKLRMLHRQLMWAYLLLALTAMGVTLAILFAGHPLTSIATTLCAWGFVRMALCEWEASK